MVKRVFVSRPRERNIVKKKKKNIQFRRENDTVTMAKKRTQTCPINVDGKVRTNAYHFMRYSKNSSAFSTHTTWSEGSGNIRTKKKNGMYTLNTRCKYRNVYGDDLA